MKVKDKLGFFVRTHRKLSIALDSLKGILIAIILIFLIVFFISAVIHNIFRVIESTNEYSGEYKNVFNAGDAMINIYTEGNGERNIVILPGIGDSSPVIQYKALADSLSNAFNVVIVEPLGYGYSLSTKQDRTSENIINELRDGLANAKIDGPYTIVAFSNSSLYADYYSEKFPEEVVGVININPIYPESLNNEKFKDKYLPNLISNANFYSIVSFSGLFRWESYIKEEKYNIDKMKKNDSYTNKEIDIYRNRVANKYLTSEMKKELGMLEKNMTDLNNFKFSDSLPTLQVITKSYRDEYLQRGENVSKYASNMISNKQIQKVRTIDGDLSNYLFESDKIKELKSLINMYF